jgi:hypothetical protein
VPDVFDEIPLDKNPNPEREVLRFETPEEREKHLRNVNLEQDINERRKFASRSFRLTYVWIIFIILSTITQFILNAIGRGLPVPDFIALITTTSATVFGFWLLVGRYLFPSAAVKQPPPPK